MKVILVILAVPLIEIALFIVIGGEIGVWATLAWVVISAVLGILVLRRTGASGPVTLTGNMHELQDAASPVAHRVMLVIAGTLLLLPGFLTDSLGLLLLVRPVRTGVIRLIARRFGVAPMAGQADVIEGSWASVDSKNGASGQDRPSGWTRH